MQNCFALSFKVVVMLYHFPLIWLGRKSLSFVGSAHKTFTHEQKKKKLPVEFGRVHWTEWIRNRAFKCKTVEELQKMGRSIMSSVLSIFGFRHSICIDVKEKVHLVERNCTPNYLCRTRHFSLALFTAVWKSGAFNARGKS